MVSGCWFPVGVSLEYKVLQKSCESGKGSSAGCQPAVITSRDDTEKSGLTGHIPTVTAGDSPGMPVSGSGQRSLPLFNRAHLFTRLSRNGLPA